MYLGNPFAFIVFVHMTLVVFVLKKFNVIVSQDLVMEKYLSIMHLLFHSLHESFCSHKQRSWMFGSLGNTKVFVTLDVLHALIVLCIIFKCIYVIIIISIKHACGKSLILYYFFLQHFKMKSSCMWILMWIMQNELK